MRDQNRNDASGQRDELRHHGADWVVEKYKELHAAAEAFLDSFYGPIFNTYESAERLRKVLNSGASSPVADRVTALPLDIIEPPFPFGGGDRTIAATFLPHVVISTVRLSIDHGHGGTPLWYETMVFAHDGKDISNWGELDADRYTFEEQAREGHEVIVKRWRNRPEARAVWEDE